MAIRPFQQMAIRPLPRMIIYPRYYTLLKFLPFGKVNFKLRLVRPVQLVR